MPFARVISHSDAVGTIDAVGDGPPDRVGRRVQVFRAQSYRAFGASAEFTVVPSELAVDLPDEVSDELGACLGIAGITAHRAVFADGPVAGQTVLVHGVLGGVGSLAAQLAVWGGASVIATARSAADLASVKLPAVALDALDPARDIRAFAPGGVDRFVEVAFSENLELDRAVAAVGATIAVYGTRDGTPAIPFWPMLFDNLTIRLLGSDDFLAEAKRQAARDLTCRCRCRCRCAAGEDRCDATAGPNRRGA